MTKFNASWNSSKQPRKQRKYRANAPLHLRQKLMHAHLSTELRQKHKTRSVQLRTGDKVRILRGEHRKKEGKVERVNLKREKVFIVGIEAIRKDGTKVPFPLQPSNLLVIEMELGDKKRLGMPKKEIKLEKK
ncbi:50S ribosomal protein L24 [Candidatus Woesearchaeota archaeon]|nr:50S ribosomal protein L24 [Candidatus Woesearchaeota archaeon]